VTDLFWPGDERAGALLSDARWLSAMESVESAWLGALVSAGIAPDAARHDVRGLVGPGDLESIAAGAEVGGNPVIGLVTLLRERLPDEPARWLHRGLTSQDVVDTGLVVCLHEVLDRLVAEHRRQLEQLIMLAAGHADTPEVGRTLTQHAVPITFGLKVAGWLTGVLDAAEAVLAASRGLAVQLGGAAGSLAASTELARLRGLRDPVAVSWQLVERTAAVLGLPARPPWHTVRSSLTRVADTFVSCTDAYGHIAADVTTLSRPEIGELAEGSGGGSSTMPHKRNPALSVLIRRAALAAPGLAATLHLAAGTTVDERPDGSWHAEWATLRTLGRRTVVASSQTSDLLAGLRVDTDRMVTNLQAAAGVDAEQSSMIELIGGAPDSRYRGASVFFVDAAVRRGRDFMEVT
jgi:3-carboxy-cis,cis-muconate cycloisomerase